MKHGVCGWLLVLALVCPGFAAAEKQVVSRKVATGPLLDGNGFDPCWGEVKPVAITDSASKRTILLSSVHTDDKVYFLVQYPDMADNLLHKPWVWDAEGKSYVEGMHREDTFVFKWNLEDHPVNLSNFSDDDYRADLWYWKANRTNPAGYADDKLQILGGIPVAKATETLSASGRKRYLQRCNDAGQGVFTEYRPASYEGEIVDRFPPAQPDGSRADVRASGTWAAGLWVIEFERRLRTGHNDDLQFEAVPGKSNQFGVSIFSLYGEPFDEATPNYYGKGRISEALLLSFQ